MRPTTAVLAISLLVSPLAVFVGPQGSAFASGFDQLVNENYVQVQATGGKVFEPAPISLLSGNGVSPAERAAGSGSRSLDAGPVSGTPFSDSPSGLNTGTMSQSSTGDSSYAVPGSNIRTPALGK